MYISFFARLAPDLYPYQIALIPPSNKPTDAGFSAEALTRGFCILDLQDHSVKTQSALSFSLQARQNILL